MCLAIKRMMSILTIIIMTIAFLPVFGLQSADALSKPNKVTITSASAKSATSISVKWKKVKGAKGYQLRYSRKSSMKGSKTISVKSRSKTIKKLKSGKKYYIQIRAYKKKGSKKIYGKWSKKTVVIPHKHNYGEWKTIKEPTCTENGFKEKTCSECGDISTEVIPAVGHVKGESVVENEIGFTVTSPSTADSVTYCTSCGQELSRETVVTGKSVKDTLESMSWSQLSSVAQKISKAKNEQEAIDIAIANRIISSDGKLTGEETKQITLTNGDKAEVQILGFYHDDKSDGSGKAGITFGFKDCIARRSVDSGSVGWENSNLYNWINNTLYDYLPNEVKESIVSVEKLTNNAGWNSDLSGVTPTSDRLWLLSCAEVCGTWNNFEENKLIEPYWYERCAEDMKLMDEIVSAEGKQYKLYKDNGVTDCLEITSKTWHEPDPLDGHDEGYWDYTFETYKEPLIIKQYKGTQEAWVLRTPLPFDISRGGDSYHFNCFYDVAGGACFGNIIPQWSEPASEQNTCLAPAFCF